MLSTRLVLPSTHSEKPPVILVHGAANSGIVWRFWQRELAERGYASYALDLRGHGASMPFDLDGTSMSDYVDDVRFIAAQLSKAPVLIGWSMGGLVSLMAAGATDAVAWVGLEPSVPNANTGTPKREGGVFDNAEYGAASDNLDDQPAMPDLTREERIIALSSRGLESRFARNERHAGIAVTDATCPLLVVSGNADYAHANYGQFPLEHESHVESGVSHWGLVLSEPVVRRLATVVDTWLQRVG